MNDHKIVQYKQTLDKPMQKALVQMTPLTMECA